MKFGNMLSNPALGGKVLLGGGFSLTKMFMNKETGKIDWVKAIGGIAVLALSLAILAMLIGQLRCELGADKTEGMTGTTQFGVGPTASHIPGYGTYGYAQALTYNLQREPNEIAEQQIVEAQRRADRKYENAEDMANMDTLMLEGMVDPLVAESMANQWLEEQMANMDERGRGRGRGLALGVDNDPADSLGFLGNPFASEGMSNLCDNVISDGGVHGLLRRATRVGYDVQSGEAARAVNQLYRGCVNDQENMADLSPTVLTSGARVRKPVNPIFNIGLPSVDPEAFSDMRSPRRSEHMSNPRVMEEDVVGMRKGNFVVTQTASPNIGEIGSGQVGYQDPTQVDLAGRPASLIARSHMHAHSAVVPDGSSTVPNVESFGLLPTYKKKGSEIAGYSRQYSGGETTRYADSRPYSGDQVKFLSLSKDNQGAKVVESDCDENGRCKISFVEQPGKFTDLVDVIYELNRTEREELINLGRRFTRYQLDSRERLLELNAKRLLAQSNPDVKFTELDNQEVETLKEFLEINGNDIDRYNNLVKKSLVKLSEKQYIVARNVPYNGCQVPKDMRRYGTGGKLVNLSKFLPANACDYLDYDRQFNKTALVGKVSKDDMVKMSDSIKANLGK